MRHNVEKRVEFGIFLRIFAYVRALMNSCC